MDFISKWDGSVEINGNQIASDFDISGISGAVTIKLLPKSKTPLNETDMSVRKASSEFMEYDTTYVITVKPYMTRPASPDFDLMERWNANIPMPLRTMVGELLQETTGMVKMRLHGDIIAKVTQTCMCCGKAITNDISKYFGLGPVCGGHNYVNPFGTQEELDQAVAEYRKKLVAMTWEGWIPKSAILSKEAKE